MHRLFRCTRLVACVVVALLFMSVGCTPSDAQQSSDDALSTERIVENLKLEIPQLRAANPTLRDVRASTVKGFKRATLQVGQRQLPVLISSDGTQLLLLASEPLDVSRTIQEIDAQQSAQKAERMKRLANVMAGMPARGPSDAPVTVVEFSEFQCPYCQRAQSSIDRLLKAYPDKVRLVYLHFPLPMHGWAEPAAIASQCAARQSEAAFWTLHDALFTHQGSITKQNLTEKAATYLQGTSIDMQQWRTCATDPSSAAHKEAQRTVRATHSTGRALGVQGTPAFFINGTMVEGAQPFSVLKQHVEEALKESSDS
ncbi:DsbA family protein [Salisaeta longa]|uniref:DsbA family protein n=1 Tax=Salisaeta longa TaxID=503170 RepID=UPI0004004C8C|nr:thioredoxin domain-containing protein [Salisaeta longa]